MIGGEYEKSISDIGSHDAALPRSHAVWILYVCAVCGDGGVWSYSISILHEAEDCGHVGIHCDGIIIPTII